MPQASQICLYRRAKSDIWLAIPPALEKACGMERNMKICPKCKGNVADGLNVCTHCGAVITPQAAKPKKKDSTEVKRDNQAIAITSVIITLVGIFIMFEVSACKDGLINIIEQIKKDIVQHIFLSLSKLLCSLCYFLTITDSNRSSDGCYLDRLLSRPPTRHVHS